MRGKKDMLREKMLRKFVIFILAVAVLFVYSGSLFAYWIWTPKDGKWINPKYAVKDTPDEQMDWAMGFYDTGEYKKAISEFEKLIESYPNSIHAPLAQYYIGRSYKEIEDHYQAFLAYQKTIDKYPYNKRVEEIIERQYKIGSMFLEGQKAKIMGMKILPALDKAVEILTKVVENAPYGRYADVAQFKLAEAYKKQEFYEEAVLAYQKIIDDYPNSPLAEDAKYQIALCTYYVSRDPYYDQEFTDRAIEEYQELIKKTSDIELYREANENLNQLREKKAKSAFGTARFYERTKHYRSAIVYYKEIVEKYENTSIAPEALEKITELEKKIENPVKN
jgi:outer membrane protein assembly factor BamD